MKNLIVEKSEKLEGMASFARMRQDDNPARGVYGRYHNRNDYPWKAMWRFLTSSVGQKWDDVFSKYCKLSWVPDRFKTIDKICQNNVILHTFMRDGEVWYYDSYRHNRDNTDNAAKISECGYGNGGCFYLHPKTRLLCYQPKRSRKKNNVEEQSETMRILGDYHQLLKLNGVWHEVKGEPVKSKIVEIGGLHYLLTNYNIIKKPGAPGGFIVASSLYPKDGEVSNYKIIDGKVYIPHQTPRYSEHKGVGPKDRLLEDKTKDHPYWQRKNYDDLKITLCRQLNSKELKKFGIKNDHRPIGRRCKKCGGTTGKDCHNHVCPKCDKYNENCKCYPWRN